MYIGEVIRNVDLIYPNEYSTEEKYAWCDELSSMLTQEYLKKYGKVTVKPSSDGTYILPEGITFEMIDRVIDGPKEIDKLDFRSYGIEYLYGKRGRFIIPEKHRVRGDICVVYIKKHQPIRDITVSGTYSFSGNILTMENTPFIKGDIVDIVTDNGEFGNICVLDVTVNGISNGKVENHLYLSDIDLNGEIKCTIERVVTDKTVCDAPYDSMYIDYLIAKIAYYQRNYSSYNQQMNLFNNRLLSYQSYLQQRRTLDKDGKIKNWW